MPTRRQAPEEENSARQDPSACPTRGRRDHLRCRGGLLFGTHTLDTATLTVDLSGFGGKVRFESDACAEDSPGLFRCELTDVPWTADGTVLLEASLAADADTPPDSTGRADYTFTSPQTEEASGRTSVSVGPSVNLTSGGDGELSAAPGDAFGLPLNVANTGMNAVDGVVAVLNAEYSTVFTTIPANCEHVVDEFLFSRLRCRFAQTLTPGVAYTLSDPLAFALRVDTVVPGATGTIRLADPHVSDSDVPLPADLDPANDNGTFVLN